VRRYTKEAAALAVARIFRQLSGAEAVAAGNANTGAAAAKFMLPLASGQQPVAAAAAPAAGAGDKVVLPATAASATAAAAAFAAGAGAVDSAAAGAAAAAEAPGLLGTGRLADRRPFDSEELTGLAITDADFTEALTRVQPSAQREGFTTTPEVRQLRLTLSKPELKARLVSALDTKM
jgi:ribosome biogenesis ATPase